MGLSSNLDIDELLNYLISGSFFLATILIGNPLLLQFASSSLSGAGGNRGLSVAILVIFLLVSTMFMGIRFNQALLQ